MRSDPDIVLIGEMRDNETIRLERTQLSHGRIIRVVSVFPRRGRQAPEDKLKALVDLEIRQGKLCA